MADQDRNITAMEPPDPPDSNSSTVSGMINFMSETSPRERRAMATMDDAQFNASLDALLAGGGASPPAACEDTTNSGPLHPVSTDPSVASSCSSSVDSSKPSQHATYATASAGAAAQMQQQSHQTAASHKSGPARGSSSTESFSRPQTVMFPAPKAPVAGIRPSPLTARLNFGFAASRHSAVSSSWSTTSSLTSCGQSQAVLNSHPRTSALPKRAHSQISAVSEDEEERLRRRKDRNIREQQRSHRITEQIATLREILSAARVKTKPDKYSTLVSVADYIKELEARSQMLDAEHGKLLDTIEQTNKMVNSQYYQASTSSGTAAAPMSNDLFSDGNDAEASASSFTDDLREDDFAVFVQGLDYKNVFRQSGVALAVASVDGRFLDCNKEFERLSGFARHELLAGEIGADVNADGAPSETVTPPHGRNLSLFNLLSRDDMERVFMAMSCMLKKPMVPADAESQSADSSRLQQDFWSGLVTRSRQQDQTLRMNVTLARSPHGRPRFFNCALSPLENS